MRLKYTATYGQTGFVLSTIVSSSCELPFLMLSVSPLGIIIPPLIALFFMPLLIASSQSLYNLIVLKMVEFSTAENILLEVSSIARSQTMMGTLLGSFDRKTMPNRMTITTGIRIRNMKFLMSRKNTV